MTETHAQLAEVQSLKTFNAALLRQWMQAATQCMNPSTVTGKDFNRMGELLIAASKQLEDERKRLNSEIRSEESRKRMDALLRPSQTTAANATATATATPRKPS